MVLDLVYASCRTLLFTICCYDMDIGFINLAGEDNTVILEILTEELKLRNQPSKYLTAIVLLQF